MCPNRMVKQTSIFILNIQLRCRSSTASPVTDACEAILTLAPDWSDPAGVLELILSEDYSLNQGSTRERSTAPSSCGRTNEVMQTSYNSFAGLEQHTGA